MISTMQKIVWFGEIKWDYLVTRKQQILTRFPREYKILYIEPYVVGKPQHWLPKTENNITVMTIPFLKNIPDSSSLSAIQDKRPVRWLAALFGLIYFQFWAILLGFAGRDRWVGLSAVHWGKVASRLAGKRHFYDANDAHLDFPGTPSWLAEYLQAYLKQADLCFAVSPEISDDIVARGARNVHLLGNGVDFEHFSTPQPLPAELKDIKGPILGYAGAMDWLDAELIQKICVEFEDLQVVLIGPEIRPGWFASQPILQGLENLHYLGRVEYKVLPAFVQNFNVALIPFVVNELTKPLNPNKLYEYSAAGKPVVSMNYSSTIDSLKDVIFVAGSHEEFIRQTEQALNSEDDVARLDLARANSWDHVSQTFLARLLES